MLGGGERTGNIYHIYIYICTYIYICIHIHIHIHYTYIHNGSDLDVLPHDAGVVVQGLVAAELVEAEALRGAVVARGEDAGEDCCGDVWGRVGKGEPLRAP